MTSSADKSISRSNFAELSEADCKEHIEKHSAGRIGFMAPDGPQILPVTYQYRNGSIIFRTSFAGACCWPRPANKCRFRDRWHR
jgi:nitroimidazol reductase NimA-like FMN-containing flavoprotein (pyridoxamine 5'-phosphate oxidase superfamily)